MKTICTTTANDLCTVKVCEINKSDAEEMLKNNTRNRPINERNVKLLTRSMNDGKWMFNGDTIVVDCDGYLKSGQHRLTAFVKSNIQSLTCIIVHLLNSKDVLLTLNRGRSMNCSQYLSIIGLKSSKSLASLARNCICLIKGESLKDCAIPDYDIEEFVKSNPCLHDFVCAAKGCSVYTRNIQMGVIAPLCAISIEFPSLKDEMLNEVEDAKCMRNKEGRLSDILIREAGKKVGGYIVIDVILPIIMSQMVRVFNGGTTTRRYRGESKTYEDVRQAAANMISRRNVLI